MPRYAAKVDNNHRNIVDALRQAFGPDAVFDTSGAGRGFPDIWTDGDWAAIEAEFYRQRALVHSDTSEFLNPTIESISEAGIVFRCYCDGCDNEEDSWHFTLDRKTGEFIE
jgi:hypothetical protein